MISPIVLYFVPFLAQLFELLLPNLADFLLVLDQDLTPLCNRLNFEILKFVLSQLVCDSYAFVPASSDAFHHR